MQEVDAENVPRSFCELRCRRGRKHREHSATLPQLERAEIAKEPLDIPAKLGVEEHAVSPLEDDLTELQEDAGLHRAYLRSRPGP